MERKLNNYMSKEIRNSITEKAEKLWGEDLHKNKLNSQHFIQLKNIFLTHWDRELKGDFLEIGCGTGADLEYFLKIKNLKTVTAIDIGKNIDDLKKKYKMYSHANIIRASALNLPFEKNKFNIVYSFGVFHHTENPTKCIEESYRVLKKNGVIFLYLYSAHEDIFFKRLGILFEKKLMQVYKSISYSNQNKISGVLSPICWLIFTVPSRILELIGLKKFSKKIPFFFGTHPFSLINDLKDRLMAPVNHRFEKNEIKDILESYKFKEIKIEKNSSGLYIFAKK